MSLPFKYEDLKPPSCYRWDNRIKVNKRNMLAAKIATYLPYGHCATCDSRSLAKAVERYIEIFCGAGSTAMRKSKEDGKYYWRVWRI